MKKIIAGLMFALMVVALPVAIVGCKKSTKQADQKEEVLVYTYQADEEDLTITFVADTPDPVAEGITEQTKDNYIFAKSMIFDDKTYAIKSYKLVMSEGKANLYANIENANDNTETYSVLKFVVEYSLKDGKYEITYREPSKAEILAENNNELTGAKKALQCYILGALSFDDDNWDAYVGENNKTYESVTTLNDEVITYDISDYVIELAGEYGQYIKSVSLAMNLAK